MSYILEVQEDDNGELFITFPDELIEELDWKEDDILEWNIKGDGVILSKLNEGPGYELLED
jgi:bifunctional DNA-binding transcriptional regulator/antitoxin component of YhaV-PrlF toxin-antitoxin module